MRAALLFHQRAKASLNVSVVFGLEILRLQVQSRDLFSENRAESAGEHFGVEPTRGMPKHHAAMT